MSKNNYTYEFIPYESIGTIKINKTNNVEREFNPQSIKWLQETSPNYVICKVLYLDNPEEIRRNGENRNHVYLKYKNQTIELTCYFDKFINNFKNICGDIEIVDDDKYTHIYSDTLGITAVAEIFKEFENQKLIRLIAFSGRDEYKEMKNGKLVDELVKKIEKLPVDKITTIAELIQYDPEKEFINPLEQGKILYSLTVECNRKNINIEQIHDEIGGLAFFYKLKKIDKKYNTYKINDNISFEDEETKREYQKYLDEINDYNEKIARGENPTTDITELMNKFKEKFMLLDEDNKEINFESKNTSLNFNNNELINKINDSLKKIDKNTNNTITNMINSYSNLYDESENEFATNLYNNRFKNDFYFAIGSIMGSKHKLYIYINNNNARFIENNIIRTINLDKNKLKEIKDIIIDNMIDKKSYEQLKDIHSQMSEMAIGVKSIFEIYIDGIFLSVPYALNTLWGKELFLKIYELL